MANPVYNTYLAGTTGAQAPIILDQAVAPFTVGVGVYLTAGTASYAVQFTFDDPNGAATLRWFNDATLGSGTTSGTTSYAFPVRAVRLNITTLTGGNLEFKVIQGYGISG